MTLNSDAIEYENNIASNLDRRIRIKTYLTLTKEYIKLSESLVERAKEIIRLGIRDMDALHIAFAEQGNAEYFVTCDDDIIKKVQKCPEKFKVKVCGILEFLKEVIHYGKDN